MQKKMFYICVICTRTKPPLIVMTAEHRQILNSVASPYSNYSILRVSEVPQAVTPLINPSHVAGKKNTELKSHCILIKKSELFMQKADIKFGTDGALEAPRVMKEPEVFEVKTEPELQMEDYTMKSKELTEELIIKDEPEFEPEPEIEPDLETKSDVDDIPECEANPVAANPVSEIIPEIKTDPDFRDSESTDTCESDYGNDEDIILAALVKTNTPTLPYLKGVDTEPEINIIAAKDIRTRFKKPIQSAGKYVRRVCPQRLPTKEVLQVHYTNHVDNYVCLCCRYHTADKEIIKKHRCPGMKYCNMKTHAAEKKKKITKKKLENDSAGYSRQREKADVKKIKLLNKMTERQREMKRAKDREYYKKKKAENKVKNIADMTEHVKERKRNDRKKATIKKVQRGEKSISRKKNKENTQKRNL